METSEPDCDDYLETYNEFKAVVDDSMPIEESGSHLVGLTDLEKAYRDILNEPVSPTTTGGMKSFIRAFKP